MTAPPLDDHPYAPLIDSLMEIGDAWWNMSIDFAGQRPRWLFDPLGQWAMHCAIAAYNRVSELNAEMHHDLHQLEAHEVGE